MKRKWVAWALSLVIVLGLLPGTAAGFSDVSDEEIAKDVEVLRMMGVLDGYPDGSFQPGGILSRAQFCKMAVTLMGKADAVGQFQSYTIFPDVRASYWAAGYVNLATRGENKLIAGYPNGTFLPENPITYGQAVTILMRLLGYADSDVGAVWPEGYLAVAATNGVTKGLDLTGDSNLTRGQAARLFVNLLAAKGKESTTPYGETLATEVQKDTVLLDVDAKADDGSEHAVKTTSGTYKAGKVQPSPILAGSKGTLLLDKDNKVLTFLPTRGATSKTITMVTAKGDKVADVTGQEYTVAGDTPVYRDEGKTTYGEIFKTLRAGQVMTLFYTPAGGIDYLFLGGATSDKAVVVSQDESEAGFSALAGGTSYTIYKNGVKVTAGDLRKNDVAVYDSTAQAIRVSDAKLTGIYESVYPNREAPAKLTIMGAELSVLPNAAGMLAPFKLGEKVTLLLTQDNQVAGAIDAKGQSNAVGVVTEANGSTAKVELLQGILLQGDSRFGSDYAAEYVGQLVQVSSSERGKLNIATLSSNVSGGMDVGAKTVGGSPLAPNIRIYERVKDSAAGQVNLEDLTMKKISSSQIGYVRRDWAGRVDLLVLDDATGDQYHYGIIKFSAGKTTTIEEEDDKEKRYTETSPDTIKVTNGDGVFGPYNTISRYKNTGYGGLIPTADGRKLSKAVTLEKVGTVTAEAWVDDDDFVMVDGVRYPVPENVQCYNIGSHSWVSLPVARSFADSFVLYADKDPDQGGKIRIVEINQ